MYKISKYITETGYCPLDNFIKELIKDGCLKDVQKIKAYVQLLEINGELILNNSTWAKKLNDIIYELRPKSNRILFFIYSENEFVLFMDLRKKLKKHQLLKFLKRSKKLWIIKGETNNESRRI